MCSVVSNIKIEIYRKNLNTFLKSILVFLLIISFMKFNFFKVFGLAVVTAFGLLTTSCQKNTTSDVTPTTGVTSTPILVSALVVSVDSTKKDSVHVCLDHDGNGHERRFYRDSVTFASLPAAVGTYLTANYTGYSVTSVYHVVDSVANFKGFIVVINFNSKPVAVLFDSTGAFVKVLEQRSLGDMDGNGPGGHHGDGDGDRFGDRDGLGRDSVSYANLPAVVKAYLTANYKQDTFRKAFKDTRTGNYVVVTTNNGVFVTIFDSTGKFISHVAAPTPVGKGTEITADKLPAAATTYLTSTYPAYVFKHALVFKDSAGTITGYAVLIDASGTKYVVRFDAAGKFVSAKVVH